MAWWLRRPGVGTQQVSRRGVPPEGRKNAKVDRKKKKLFNSSWESPRFIKMGKCYCCQRGRRKPALFDPGDMNGFQPKKYPLQQ
ncbi:hypothetical protein NPIL_208991 [Nephila pilipes]|uniref:Uncharacterized protein n=1 Tax=Nephila pilipes TaxID=299642 RepID=A0A8X6PLD3_NEPPI|nr:hypothetical protein NPIL_208991 [Nephila pilipes]